MAEFDPIVLDDLPDEVLATIESRDRALAALESSEVGLRFVVDHLRRWLPGSTVRVAFLGGDSNLHRDIAEVAGSINDECNINLDFGHDTGTGEYRKWSESDSVYSAEIRVSFDIKGYFSLVGTDSMAANIGNPSGSVGGRPWQRSLNLGGFHIQKPATWRGTVLHEFLHALSLHHEHASVNGPCQHAFRWEDDTGYVPTQDANQVFVSDTHGRRPGIYTFLSGAPNFWSHSKVDQNLKTVTGAGIEASAFDRMSVMLYRFPALFYQTPSSDCAPLGDGQALSDGDIAGLQTLYPHDQEEAIEVISGMQRLLAVIRSTSATAGLNAIAAETPTFSMLLQGSAACLENQLVATSQRS